MLNQPYSQIIAYLCYYIDKVCRHELYIGNIANERDYVSNIGTHLRFPFGPFFTLRLAIARTLPQNLETTFGCDSIIIFKKGNTIKFGLFEAKWPRYFLNKTYQWDKANTAGISRFSSQIERQKNWAKSGAVIWEMFFNESKPGETNKPFDTFGSSCLLHSYASSYLDKNKFPLTKLWDNNDLLKILPQSMNFRRIVYNILRCNFGKVFKINRNSFIISSKEQQKIEVPIFAADVIESGLNELITSFMEKNGISHYISVDINEMEEIISV